MVVPRRTWTFRFDVSSQNYFRKFFECLVPNEQFLTDCCSHFCVLVKLPSTGEGEDSTDIVWVRFMGTWHFTLCFIVKHILLICLNVLLLFTRFSIRRWIPLSFGAPTARRFIAVIFLKTRSQDNYGSATLGIFLRCPGALSDRVKLAGSTHWICWLVVPNMVPMTAQKSAAEIIFYRIEAEDRLSLSLGAWRPYLKCGILL